MDISVRPWGALVIRTSRPINLTADEVLAILDGRLKQLRRPFKADRKIADVIPGKGNDRGIIWFGAGSVPLQKAGDLFTFRCRFGIPGDDLWGRESFARVPFSAYARSDGVQQARDPKDRHTAALYRAGFTLSSGGIRWLSATQMPRWASRISLEITSVRVERPLVDGTPWVWAIEFTRMKP